MSGSPQRSLPDRLPDEALLRLHAPFPLRHLPLQTQQLLLAAMAEALAEGAMPGSAAAAPTVGPWPGEALPVQAPQLLGLTGKPRAGKDAVAAALAGRFASVACFAFSDAIIAEANAWLAEAEQALLPERAGRGRRIDEHSKNDGCYRRLLQAWGIARRAQDERYWTRKVAARVGALQRAGVQMVVVTGARAPSDVELLASLGGELWQVERPANSYRADSPIEQALDGLPASSWQARIVNDASLEALAAAACTALASGERGAGRCFLASASGRA